MNVMKELALNIAQIDERLANCGDIVKREFPFGVDNNMHALVIYIDMLVNRDLVEKVVMENLMHTIKHIPSAITTIKDDLLTKIKDGGLATADLSEKTEFDEVFLAVLSGDTALFIDGFDRAIVISTKGWPNRGVPTTENEVVVQGSKEAFSEVFRINSMLIRRRIRDTNLKLEQMKIGKRSQTDVAIMYLEDVAKENIVIETKKRLKNIDIDAILDCGYIEQFIEDDWISPFPQVQTTERPDKASSAILEGRIIIIVDNSPFVLIVPATLNAFYQASEDYYQRFHIMSLVRLIRYVAGALAFLLPAFYIATAVYHPSMIPMLLTYKLAEARATVPFPAVIEILLMDFAFELLKEAGLRLPRPVGTAIGIVGGLIIGQAAVEAGLVSPIVVIIVALTGICGFAIPNQSLVSGYRIMKYLMIFTASLAGLFGFWIGLLIILIHLVSLKSFGYPYMYPFTSGEYNNYSDFKDTLFRLPLFYMKKRPIFAKEGQKVRMNVDNTGNEKKKE